MTLSIKGLLILKENAKTLVRRQDNKRPAFRKTENGDWHCIEDRSWQRSKNQKTSFTRESTRNETIRRKLTVLYSHLNSTTMRPSSQSCHTIEFKVPSGGEPIRTTARKICMENLQWNHVTAVGKSLKPRCQVTTENITYISVDFVENRETHNRSTRPDMAALFNEMTNDRCINVQNGNRRQHLSGTTQRTNFPSSLTSKWFNIIIPYHGQWKTCEQEGAMCSPLEVSPSYADGR